VLPAPTIFVAEPAPRPSRVQKKSAETVVPALLVRSP